MAKVDDDVLADRFGDRCSELLLQEAETPGWAEPIWDDESFDDLNDEDANDVHYSDGGFRGYETIQQLAQELEELGAYEEHRHQEVEDEPETDTVYVDNIPF